ncbi:MAG: hypothetical protein R3B72_21495 [Polyangiaceae bacterium]
MSSPGPLHRRLIRKHTKFREASVPVGALAALAIMGLTVWAVVAH